MNHLEFSFVDFFIINIPLFLVVVFLVGNLLGYRFEFEDWN